MPPRRLHFGCGPVRPRGWTNCDRLPGDGVALACDLRDGIPVPDEWFDYAVGIHVVQDVPYADVPRVLGELRRVLKRGGTLRLAVPDLDRAIDAYRRNDHAYFYVPDEHARSIGAKLVTQIVWYGSVRTPCTFDFLAEKLEDTGFRAVARCAYRETRSGDPAIAELDNRERESLFVEAMRD
jgi:predicted SAM-dependent methyltransferase